MPRKKRRARSNPTKAELTVYRRSTFAVGRGHKAMILMLPYDHYAMVAAWVIQGTKRLSITIDLGRPRYAEAILNERTLGLKWSPLSKGTLEEYGPLIDQLIQWYFDESMPPAGVDEAIYDVEV